MMRRNCCLQNTVCKKEDSPYSLFRAHKASVTAVLVKMLSVVDSVRELQSKGLENIP